MRKFSFEKNGINYNVIETDNLLEAVENNITHNCKICGNMFSNEKELAKCPNGCEGLIRRIKNE